MRAALVGAVSVALGFVGAAAFADERDWGVLLNGKAVHLGEDRDWNENNWGLGVEREFDRESLWVKVVFANGFIDSNDEMSYMAGGGIKRRFRPLSRRRDVYLDGGVVGFLMTRADVRNNQPFPGLLPAVTMGMERFALNLSYVPGSFVTKATGIDEEASGIEGIMFLQFKLTLPDAFDAFRQRR